jgi:PIN domain nuclease of toxin-antitoxin system
LEFRQARAALLGKAEAAVILLDTNALLWLDGGHRRIRPLARWAGRLQISPVSLLELQFLVEAGRVQTARSTSLIVEDPRWTLDEPPAGAWFEAARSLSWTRDPFDRLIVAHAQLRRWRLATADGLLIEKLGAAALEL